MRLGLRLKRLRLAEGLTQAQLAQKIGVHPSAISQWENEYVTPASTQLDKLEKVLGLGVKPKNGAADQLNEQPAVSGAFGAWLRKARDRAGLSVPELAAAAGISAVAIYNIEAGKSLNPQAATRARLAQALKTNVPDEVQKEAQEEQNIVGLGSLTDFDPYNPNDLPTVAGVYVFYDVSDRPVYVGKAKNIAQRVGTHKQAFWFRDPIVQGGAFVEIKEDDLRHKVEQVLIKFLKSNAVINKQSVDR